MNQIVRALPRPVPVAEPTADLVALGEASVCGEAWDDLVGRAADPNPHASRHVVGAHARSGLAPPNLPLVVARRGRDWLALAPIMPRSTAVGVLSRARASWTSPFVTLGTPLLDGENLQAAADTLLDGFASGTARLALLRAVPLDSATAKALAAALARRGWPYATLGAFERAVLERRRVTGDDPGAWQSASRRKDLRRRRARLRTLGTVAHRSATTGAALTEAVEAFLALEASGWKGGRGTALASRPETAAFARHLFAEGGGPVEPRADLLTLDGRTVAASLALVCAGTAHLLKTAYDEALRPCAPGLLLEEEIIRACLTAGFADRLDSAACGRHVLADFLPHRERIGDLLFATSPAVSPSALARVAARETLRRRWLEQGKAAWKSWRKAAST